MFSTMKFILSFLIFMTSVMSLEKYGPVFLNRKNKESAQDIRDPLSLKDIPNNKYNLFFSDIGYSLQEIAHGCKTISDKMNFVIITKKCNSFSEKDYVSGTKAAIKKFYKTKVQKSDSEITKILEIIYKKMKTTSKSVLAVFTAHAIFNTSAFANLSENSNDRFRSRGLLAIQGEENYKLLVSLTNGKIKFNDKPCILESLKPEVIGAQIAWWNDKMKCCASDFCITLGILNPTEWTKFHNKNLDEDSSERLKRRRELYDTLIECYQDTLIECYQDTLIECYQDTLVECYQDILIECYQ